MKGSFTVEAALLMPFVLLVIFGAMYLCFFVHNRAWYTQAACETAVSAASESVRKCGNGKELAQIKGEEAASVVYPGMENLKLNVDAQNEKISIEIQGECRWAIGGRRFTVRAKESSKVIRPVSFMRKVNGLKKLQEQMQ